MFTVTQIIVIAQISQWLAVVDILKRGLFGNGADLLLPRKLYMVRKNIEWMYANDPTDDTLRQTANYLYALCGIYSGEARRLINAGGSVAPISPMDAPTPYYFIVGDGELFEDGQTEAILPTTWDGYNITFARGGVVQTTVDTEPTYFSWDKNTRIITITPAAVTSELFAIIPV